MNSKKVLLLCAACLAALCCLGAEEWGWVASGGGLSGDYARDVTTDDLGNIYVIGEFQNYATFGATTINAHGSTDKDVFVGKLDAGGNWLWAVSAGSAASDYGRSIITDGVGNVYITGSFEGTATFGSIILESTGYADIFVAKLDCSGNWIWAKKAGGTAYDEGFAIATDEAGNVYITGYFVNAANFGAYTLPSNGYEDIFVARLDTNGNWLWAVNAGGTGFGDDSKGYGIAVDDSGNVYITGYFEDDAEFGATNLDSSGAWDIYVAKLNNSGNWLWAVNAGGTGNDRGSRIAADASGNALICGAFTGTATFGTQSLTCAGYSEAYAAKLDASGNWLWAASSAVASDSGCNGSDIELDEAGNTFLAGYFWGAGEVAFGTTTLTSSGGDDIFAAKLDADGNWLWALGAGGPSSSDQGHGIAVDSSGNAWLTGVYEAATFGDTSLPGNGSWNVFVAEILSPAGELIPLPPANLNLTINGMDVYLDWDDVTEDTTGNPVTIDHYLVYCLPADPWGDHFAFGSNGSITSSQWVHSGAATSYQKGFYYVTAVTAE
ncbi:MAG: SBBP repeat-containing protein [Candidatus Cloacimonetes bacterium]|nr:SBBP repeat-containing protein [Candidatus Cloacimonadota bacterium]